MAIPRVMTDVGHGDEELHAQAILTPEPTVAVGCEVRIRRLTKPGFQVMPSGITLDDQPERVVAIVPKGQGGLYRLTPGSPLAKALLGRRVGDEVQVTVQAGTVPFLVLAVWQPGPTMGGVAGVAEWQTRRS